MKRKRSLIGIISLLFILLALPIAGSKTSEAAQAKTLKIGCMQFLTGAISGFGIQSERELQVLVKIINKDGGITVNGQAYNIEVVTEDCKTTMDGTAAAARKLTFDEQCNFIVGPAAFFSAAANPIFNHNKVLNVSVTDTLQPGEMGADTPYTFLGIASVVGYNYTAFEVIKKKWPEVKNIVFILPDDGTGPYVVPLYQNRAESMGFTLATDTILYPIDTIDFSTLGARLNAIKNADLYILIAGTPPAVGGMVKILRSLGNTKPYVFSSISDAYDIKAVAGEEAATNVMNCGFTRGDPEMPALISKITARTEAEYGSGPIFMYWATALYSLLDAIEKAQSLDPDVVKAKWESMDTIDTLFGEGKIGGLETYGIRHAIGHPLPFQLLKDGNVSSLGWWFVEIP